MSVLKTKDGDVVVKGPIKLTQSSGNILEVGTSVDKTVISNGWTSGTGDWLKFEVPSADDEGGLLQLNSNGKVGIGTSSPTDTLDVNGSAKVGYLLVAPQDANGYEGGEINLQGSGSSPDIHLDNGGGALRVHTLAAGKRVEIIGGDGLLVTHGAVTAPSFIGDGSQLTNLPSTDTRGDSASNPVSSTLSNGWNNWTRQARVYLSGYPAGTYITTMQLWWWTAGQYNWDPYTWQVASTTEYSWGSRGTSTSTYVNIGASFYTATASQSPYLTFSNTVRTS